MSDINNNNNGAIAEKNEATKGKDSKAKKWETLALIASSLLFVVTFCFYGPIGLFLSNADEFWFSLKDTLIVVIPISLIVLFLLVVVGTVLPVKLRDVYVKLLFGISLGLYIQGTFLNINYGNGVLDGGEIEWDNYKQYAALDSLAWIIFIAAPFIVSFVAKGKAKIAIVALSAYCILMQIPAIVVDFIKFEPSTQADITISREGIYELGGDKNILVIAFDTTDESYFQDYISKHPEFVDELDGFVHYDNMLASGARTIIGVPSLLTGKPFNRDVSYTQYIENIWKDDNPLKVLNKEGYDVRCFSDPTFYGSETTRFISNISNGEQGIASYFTLGRKLYKLTSFRFMPHIAKRYFWMTTAEFDEAKESIDSFVTDDAKFHRDLLEHGYVASADYDKAYRFYLLKGMHSPYTLTSDGLDNSSKTTKEEQQEGTFVILKSILDSLKETGLYDNSAIIITADHGDVDRSQHLMFLYKGFDSHGEFTTTHVPGSMFDLSTLVTSLAGQEFYPSKYCMNLLSLEEGAERERHFFHNTTNKKKVSINEYKTVADASDYDALELVEVYVDKEDENTPYSLGTKLTFDMDATANKYCVDGFGNTSGFLTRICGPHAEMRIPFKDLPESGDLQLIFEIGAIYKYHDFKIFANGVEVFASEEVGKDDIESKGISCTFDVKEVFGSGSILDIEFVFEGIDEEELEKAISSRTRVLGVTTFVVSIVD